MRQLKFLILGIACGWLQACGSCQEIKTPTMYTEYGSYHLTIVNPDSTQLDLELNTSEPIRSGSFLLNTGFTRPDKPFPESEVSVRFYFRETALPGGEDIFEQKKGDTFEIPITPYNVDNDDVIYRETFPPNKGWVPSQYSGKVTILEDDLVEFDLIFTDGIESRRVLATFVFKMLDLVQEVGECG